MNELFHTYGLRDLGLLSADIFIETYTRNNHELWANYHLGIITKDHLRKTRFKKTFLDLGLSPDVIPADFEDDYVRICPTKTNLFPQAIETLSYLHNKYHLHIISNGFKESTEMKIRVTGLEKYFRTVVISELVGINKPDRAIFQHALAGADALIHESIMIGDSLEADIYGAMEFGMDAIYFNPLNKEKPGNVDRQIVSLEELISLL